MRELLGKRVRSIWIQWAQQQPNPKPSWLVRWSGLSEPDKEVDRLIGEELFVEGWNANDSSHIPVIQSEQP